MTSSECIFIPAQFSNDNNTEAHYLTTGPEIWYQIQARAFSPDAFVAGVGTGGTIMGAGRFLKERNPAIQLHPLQPTVSPLLSNENREEGHRIEGIADGYFPPILDLGSLDSLISVDDGDAILMAQKLQKRMGSDAVVVTLFPDDNKKYLSTDLFTKEPLQDWFLSPDITLLGVKAYAGMCCTSEIPQK